MQELGLHITDTELIFKAYPSKDIGLALYCRSFKIFLKDIQFIAISPRLALDDEVLFILIIDHNFKIYKIPYRYLAFQFVNFEQYFQIPPIRLEWEKFEYEDHYGKIDKILYPKEYYWQDLFEKDWKLKVRNLYSWTIPKSFFGNFNSNLK